MTTPVFRRLANPLSIWIVLLAIVLQSVMPMVAHAVHQDHQSNVAVAGVVANGSHALGHAGMHAHAGGAHVPFSDALASNDVASNDAASSAGAASALLLTADEHASPANPHALHGDAPCPYCRVHLDAMALPPLPNPHWILLIGVAHRTLDTKAIATLPEPWSPIRPRDPPFNS